MTPLITVGPRNAKTDPNGLRFYEWNGVKYPSVTTIRRMAGVSFPLHEWTITQVADRAINEVSALNSILDGTPEAAAVAKTWLRAAATDARDRSADVGTRVHESALTGRLPGDVFPDEQPYIEQFTDWRGVSGVEMLTYERQVWNLTLGYAGQFDLLGKMPDGTLWIVDLKTGKGTYPEHALQAVAYAMGEFVGEDDVIDQPATELLHAVNGIAILHLQKTQWKWMEIAVTPDLFDSFRGLLTFAKWAKENQTMKNLIAAEVIGHA